MLADIFRKVETRCSVNGLRTVSKDLLKSRAITTYGCSARRLVIVWRRNTSAAVVEPVGRNAYWSENINAGGGVSSAGYMDVRTTSLSMVRVKTGVTEIGL